MLNLFDQKTFQKLTLSLSEALVKILALLETVPGWKEIDHPLLPKQLGSSMNADQEFLFG